MFKKIFQLIFLSEKRKNLALLYVPSKRPVLFFEYFDTKVGYNFRHREIVNDFSSVCTVTDRNEILMAFLTLFWD
jgi:hypothetical protein